MTPGEIREIITAYGHPNIQATHPSTLMITKEKHLSKTGDCIIAVAADKSAADLDSHFKEVLKKTNAKLTITVVAGEIEERIHAVGSQKLVLTHPLDLVVRKSEYISERTLAIHADKSSNDLSRSLVDKLKDPNQTVRITLTVTYELLTL